EIRRRICEALVWLGATLDSSTNAVHGPRISTTGSRVSVWGVPTNEELMIARHTGALLGISGRAPVWRRATRGCYEPPRSQAARGRRDLDGMGRVPRRPLAEGNQRPRLHSAQLHAIRRRRVFSRAGDREDDAALGQADHAVRRGTPERRA